MSKDELSGVTSDATSYQCRADIGRPNEWTLTPIDCAYVYLHYSTIFSALANIIGMGQYFPHGADIKLDPG